MTTSTSCPPPSDFEAMLLGSLEEARATALEEHVEHCTSCQRVLDSMAVSARLTDPLRVGTPTGTAPVAGVDEMMMRLEDMARQFTPSGYDLSASAETGFNPLQPTDTLKRMGSYRVVRLLGAGGMGLVYLAEDEVLHRRVAVKVLRPRLAKLSKAREGFLREARAMAALKHDNVVTVFQVGEAEGPGGSVVPFLAMEWLEGESLADWLRREGPVPPSWAAWIVMQAAEGLATAHARGIVHRDIKPGNLWLEAPPRWLEKPPEQRSPLPFAARVKVLDFGLAQPPGEESVEDGQHVYGTPAYMAPEQAAGKEVDPRADLFSLGVVLYELLTGSQPFPRTSHDAILTYSPPAPLEEKVPNIPPALSSLLHRLLSVEVSERPASAREVSQELAPLVSHLTDDTAPFGFEKTARLPLPKRRKLHVAAAVLALVLAGGIWLVTRPEKEAGPPVPPPPAAHSIPGPPDDEWLRRMAELPVEQMLPSVLAKLRELNPDFDGRVTRLGLEEGKVTELTLHTDKVVDIRPLRALPRLRMLSVIGSAVGKGQLADLSPLKGMPLTVLNIWNNPNLSDLSPTRGMKLILFQAGDTAVEDLSPLEGMPIGTLAVNDCRVRDVSPVRTMPAIRYLRCDGCPLTSLEPLVGSSLKELTFNFRAERNDAEVLERLPGLERINRLPANEFRHLHPVKP